MAPPQPPRPPEERKAHALALLSAHGADLWLASASPTGKAHLVPLSYAWDGEQVIVATEPDAVTTKNVVATGRARLGLGGTRDVVLLDARLAGQAWPAPDDVADRYAQQADWDPRTAGGEFVYLFLKPERVQAWREANEIAGRTLMRNGDWLV